MSEVTCPHCDDTFRLFLPVSPERTIWADGVCQLASLPFDVSAFNPTSDHRQASALDSGLADVTAALTSALPSR